jgi:transcriptional regulator with XRE-family HTH domain
MSGSKLEAIPALKGNRVRTALRKARMARGMTQADVAAMARVREREVWAAERGERPEGLAAIAFVLGVSLEGKEHTR